MMFCTDNFNSNLITAGGYHNLLLIQNKKLCISRNNDGEINVPIDLTDVIKVESGEYHSLL